MTQIRISLRSAADADLYNVTYDMAAYLGKEPTAQEVAQAALEYALRYARKHNAGMHGIATHMRRNAK